MSSNSKSYDSNIPLKIKHYPYIVRNKNNFFNKTDYLDEKNFNQEVREIPELEEKRGLKGESGVVSNDFSQYLIKVIDPYKITEDSACLEEKATNSISYYLIYETNNNMSINKISINKEDLSFKIQIESDFDIHSLYSFLDSNDINLNPLSNKNLNSKEIIIIFSDETEMKCYLTQGFKITITIKWICK